MSRSTQRYQRDPLQRSQIERGDLERSIWRGSLHPFEGILSPLSRPTSEHDLPESGWALLSAVKMVHLGTPATKVERRLVAGSSVGARDDAGLAFKVRRRVRPAQEPIVAQPLDLGRPRPR